MITLNVCDEFAIHWLTCLINKVFSNITLTAGRTCSGCVTR